MTKWEYCRVALIEHVGGVAEYWGVDGSTKVEIKPEKPAGEKAWWDAPCRHMAQMGMEGWELVACSGGDHVFFFKRPATRGE
jgi:hypothetical protein